MIATFAIIATFINHQKIDLIITSINFSLVVNLGYALINRCQDEMKMKIYEAILNISLTLAVMISLFFNHIEISRITSKIFILVTTLPNFFLSLPDVQEKEKGAEDNEEERTI